MRLPRFDSLSNACIDGTTAQLLGLDKGGPTLLEVLSISRFSLVQSSFPGRPYFESQAWLRLPIPQCVGPELGLNVRIEGGELLSLLDPAPFLSFLVLCKGRKVVYGFVVCGCRGCHRPRGGSIVQRCHQRGHPSFKVVLARPRVS